MLQYVKNNNFLKQVCFFVALYSTLFSGPTGDRECGRFNWTHKCIKQKSDHRHTYICHIKELKTATVLKCYSFTIQWSCISSELATKKLEGFWFRKKQTFQKLVNF